MSYLNSLRIHFAGGFVAAPSTVNNTIAHFDTANFKPEFQVPPEGLWNPMGDHRFTFNCPVTAVQYSDGTQPAPGADPALTMTVQSLTPGRPGKIVDLDPQHQMVSMLWGLEVTIVAAGSATALFRGKFTPAPFTDIWTRGTTGGGDERAAAMYQSVLQTLTWGNVSASRFLTELKAATTAGVVSVKFNLDGYSMSLGAGFTKGRLVGTIGPGNASEPQHFVKGRQLANISANGFNFCVASIDDAAQKIRVDLGNALTTAPSGGAMRDVGALSLVCDPAGASPLALGTMDYRSASWYEKTAGIVDLPAGRTLTAVEMTAIRGKPLALRTQQLGAAATVTVSEADNGFHVRADLFVARLNPGDDLNVTLYATQWGRPLAGVKVNFQHEELGGTPPMGTPQAALTFPASVTCDANGQASISLHASDPGNPRGYIDGQIYMVDYALDGIPQLNANDFLSVLVWDSFTPDVPTTWYGSMKPIFQQYANLYPIMKAAPGIGIDLGDYDAVCLNRTRIAQTLSLPITESHYMPVSRDLSNAKRTAMVAWLNNLGPDGKPLLGTPPPIAPFVASDAAPLGSKTLAAKALAQVRAIRKWN